MAVWILIDHASRSSNATRARYIQHDDIYAKLFFNVRLKGSNGDVRTSACLGGYTISIARFGYASDKTGAASATVSVVASAVNKYFMT